MLSFSLFSEIGSFLSAGPDALTESKLSSQDQTLFSAASDGLAEDAPAPADGPNNAEMTAPEAPTLFSLFSAPVEEAIEAAPAEGAAEETPAVKPEEEKLSIYDKTLRAQLLAMLGSSEDSLPEAELTRLVHVKLTPQDEYASEEQVDICIYGDFIFYRRTTPDGVGKTYRAGCSLRELDSFLQSRHNGTPDPAPPPAPYPYRRAPNRTRADPASEHVRRIYLGVFMGISEVSRRFRPHCLACYTAIWYNFLNICPTGAHGKGESKNSEASQGVQQCHPPTAALSAQAG